MRVLGALGTWLPFPWDEGWCWAGRDLGLRAAPGCAGITGILMSQIGFPALQISFHKGQGVRGGGQTLHLTRAQGRLMGSRSGATCTSQD